MTVRVQIILTEEERERFRHAAEREGLSLSAWLRQAGKQRLVEHYPERISSVEDLRAFFAACDAREVGREPDWEEHLAVMEGSQRAGATET